MPSPEFAILAQNLTRKFDGLVAVDSLNIDVKPGEIYGLVGPDGAGKTTTLRMLSSIMEPTAGQAWIAGFDTRKESDSVKDNIAYMSQRFGLYPDLTVLENINFYADLYGLPPKGREDKINSLLDFSYMRPFRKRLAAKLSGGMKQKLQLACALVHTPKVLLLDEPTNGVDPVSRRDFWRILYHLLQQDVSILVTTAYLDEAERCNRVALLNHGKILAQGTPQEVKKLMRGRILGIQSPYARQIKKLLQKETKLDSIEVFGDIVHVVCEDFTCTETEIKSLLDKAGLTYVEIRERVPSLEDIFVSVLDRPEVEIDATVTIGDDALETAGTTRIGEIAVTIDRLTKRFGDFVAVNDVSFEVKKGEIFGFLGPNGAGKSTVIRMLCGLLKPSSGGGTVAGFDVNRQPEDIKKHIGYMSQKFSLYEDLTVEENLTFYGGIYGLGGKRLHDRMEWAIEMSGLSVHRRSLTKILSGGWKQRLALACAILHEPPVLFLDEPTSGVDPLSRRRFWDLIYQMSDKGVTVFVTTHYMEEAEYCDRVALIFRGGIVAIGTPMELKTERMREQILDVQCPSPQDVIENLEKLPDVHEVALFGVGLHIVVDDAASAEKAIRAEFERIGHPLGHIEKIMPGMEDVFVSLIEEVVRKENGTTRGGVKN
ncbi:MAG: ATP-binding cassette domain-containing protein [bacterium]|nr:ATP-binding cassette domain-containing protein [bacterium]